MDMRFTDASEEFLAYLPLAPPFDIREFSDSL